MLDIELTFLGTGTSVGIPMVGCDCPACVSSDPRDRRFRSSVMLEWDGRVAVIDTGPEFRLQMLRERVKRLDAVLLTHNHADHVLGLDDVRPFCFRQHAAVPVYGDHRTLDWIRRQVFSYVWEAVQEGGGLPRLDLYPVDGPFALAGLEFVPVPVLHGQIPIYGYRFGDCAYLSDVSEIPASSLPLLQGLETLILDAVRYAPHATHFHVDKSVSVAAALGARQTFLTHLCHDIVHAELETRLPPGVFLAYDGLRLRCSAAGLRPPLDRRARAD